MRDNPNPLPRVAEEHISISSYCAPPQTENSVVNEKPQSKRGLKPHLSKVLKLDEHQMFQMKEHGH